MEKSCFGKYLQKSMNFFGRPASVGGEHQGKGTEGKIVKAKKIPRSLHRGLHSNGNSALLKKDGGKK